MGNFEKPRQEKTIETLLTEFSSFRSMTYEEMLSRTWIETAIDDRRTLTQEQLEKARFGNEINSLFERFGTVITHIEKRLESLQTYHDQFQVAVEINGTSDVSVIDESLALIDSEKRILEQLLIQANNLWDVWNPLQEKSNLETFTFVPGRSKGIDTPPSKPLVAVHSKEWREFADTPSYKTIESIKKRIEEIHKQMEGEKQTGTHYSPFVEQIFMFLAAYSSSYTPTGHA